jgi:O-antigen/teichoic acid export membrane protein
MRASSLGFILVISKVFEKIGSFALIVIAARILAKSEFGLFQAVSMYAILTVSIVTFALPAAHLYFLARADEKEGEDYASAVQLMLAVIGLVVGVIGAGLSYIILKEYDMLTAISAASYFLVYCAAATPASGFPNIMIASGHGRRASVSAILASAAAIAVSLSVAFATRKCWGILFGAAIGSIAQFVILYLSASKVVKISAFYHAKLTTLRRVWSYSFPLGLSNGINFVSRRIDAMVVTLAATVELYAVFSVGTIEVPVVPILVGAAWGTLVPRFSELLSRGAMNDAHDLWSRGIVKLASIILPVSTATFVFAEEIAVILFGDGFAGAAVPLRCYSFVTATRFMMIGALLSAGGHTAYQLKMSFWAVITTGVVASNAAFWGFPMWAGLGTVLGSAVSVMVGLFAVRRLYGYAWNIILPWRALAELFFGSLMILSAAYSVVSPISSALLRSAAGLGVSGIVIAILLHIRGYARYEWLRGTLRDALEKR